MKLHRKATRFCSLILAGSLWFLAAAEPPRALLWVWERPTDLRGLPARAGVAFLAATVKLQEGEFTVTPRFQPLRLGPGVFRMAVVRVEGAGGLPTEQRRHAAHAIADALAVTRAQALQIDFDATASQRVFYAALVRDVRAKLPPATFLSITALVSWCGKGSWLEGLPVDEVVPMAFEMGADAAVTETLLRSGGQFENLRCRGSIGLSAQGPKIKLARTYRRVYFFSYADWHQELVESVLSRIP